MIQRRTFLIAGGTALVAPPLSGCLVSSDDDSGGDDGTADDDGADGQDDDGDDTEEYTLGVEEFAYTNTRARAYGEFDERRDVTYDEGEMVWIYLGLSNVTPTDGGTRIDTTWEVVGPDGEVRASTEESVRIREETLEELPNEAFVTQGVDTSIIDTPKGGEYTVEVTITDTESGQSVTASETFTLRKFQLHTLVFTDGEPADVDEYDENPDATYARGETVWVYAELWDPPVDDSGKVILDIAFQVDRPDGQSWERIEETQRWERIGPDDALIFWEGLDTYEDDPAGEYTLTLTLEDQLEGKRLRTTETFTLE